jgi:hypothetical protein
MSHLTTPGRRALASASLLGLLVTGAACGTQSETTTDVGGAVRDAPQSEPLRGPSGGGQSDRALEADAARAAQGQLPPAPEALAGRRVPDVLP